MLNDIDSFILYNVTEKDFFSILEKSLLLEDPPFIQQDISQSYHLRYFSNYLKYDKNGLNVQTIVIELNYTCLTFLEDYKNFYSHCYTPYKKSCKRIHFFKENISENEFIKMIYNGAKGKYKRYWDSYVGCIIAKPLSKGIIGVTYLKTYIGDEKRNRYYTTINPYKINLFGTTCEINTLPYIEQDGIVGSCASSSLWMAFQKLSELFNTKRLSPSEITILAGYDSDNTGKVFPSKGLEVAQICKAIYNNGLISELRQSDSVNISDLKGFLYSYLKAEIPILMGIEMEDESFHLVTLTGFRLNFNIDSKEKYISQYTSKYYAHDDQTGPFSRLKIISRNNKFLFLTSWWKEDVEWNMKTNAIKEYFESEDNYLTCIPRCIIVPIDRKIKVTYEDVFDKVEVLKLIFDLFLLSDEEANNIEWDLYLTKSNKYKEEISKEVKEKKNLDNLLFSSLPQYVWVAKAYYKRILAFDFIFDSIEINHTGQPFTTNIYSTSFRKFIKSTDFQIQYLFNREIKDSLYRFIVENTLPISIIEKNSKLSDDDTSLSDNDSSIEKFDEAIQGFGNEINDFLRKSKSSGKIVY